MGVMRIFLLSFLIVVWLLTNTASSGAAPITFSGSSGNLAASATFDISGDHLIITLTNTSSFAAIAPPDILTGVYFTLSNNTNLIPVSAVLGPSSSVLYGGAGSNGSVGGEWAYCSGLTDAPLGTNQGISSAGLGLFAAEDNFPGQNLNGPDSVDGLGYGITSSGVNYPDGKVANKAVTGKNPLIQNSVVFTLDGLPPNFDLSSISNVAFQYGTSLSEPTVTTTPEPATMFLLGSGLIGLGWFGRKKFKKI